MTQTLKKLLNFLSSYERKHLILILFMTILMGLLDMIGVASIMPFIAILTNPNLVESNNILNLMFQASTIFGVENKDQFLFALGILVFILLIFSLTFNALTTYMQLKFVSMREYSIGKRLIKNYLNQPYSWFLGRNSSDIGKSILSEVSVIIANGMTPMMNLLSKSIVAFLLLTLLIIVDLRLAIIVSFTLGIAYYIIFRLTRNFLNRIGKDRVILNQMRFTAVSEAFGAAKEVKVGGLEQVYIQRYSEPAKLFATHIASSQIISQLPRFALETLAFGGMLLVILYFMFKTGSFENALPIIALYAFAGYRLMPALQQIYSSIVQLRFVEPAIDALDKDLNNLQRLTPHKDQEILPLFNEISLNNVYYNYPNSSRTALKGVNLNIPANSVVGFVGTTGSGKTTTIDIILGLLEAQKGTLRVDGKVINDENRRAWQKNIGYVPQNIYLKDDTIAANIAFGFDLDQIDPTAVKRAAKIANIDEFINNELPKKYNTIIGERGIRLSGGQRQRIGIARALYNDPQVLILDEATSSLDNYTEKNVMQAINNTKKDITIIIIAHRLNTVKNCDIIYKLEKGQIIKQGKFDKIIQ
jgi:ATP-binding cassette, subfamily B, bacterial PglK